MTDRQQPAPEDAQALGRVLDPELLDSAAVGRAKYALQLPSDWLKSGGQFEITVPRLLPCHGCDGGGCDCCDRSGALRGPDPADARTITFSLPPKQRAPFALRFAEPFGEACAVRQLVLTIEQHHVCTDGLRQLSAAPDSTSVSASSTVRLPKIPWVVVAIFAVVLLIAIGAIMER